MSARVRLAVSYLVFLGVAAALFAIVLWYLLRFVPATGNGSYFPTRPDLVEAVLPRALQALAVLALLALVGGWLLAGRMLAPLRSLDAAARDITGGSLTRRVHLDGPRDEFHRLATTFDTMMDRIETLVGEQQRFAANASHELRTPAAAARAIIEVARTDPGTDAAAVLVKLDELNRRTVEIIDALLALSVLENAAHLNARPVDVAELLDGMRNDMVATGEAAGVRLVTDVQEGDIDGDPVLVRQLLSNLVLNGIRHNLTTHGWVQMSSRADPEGVVTVRVENTGPVVPPELIASMTEPFVRGGGRTNDGGEAPRSAGLGLALVEQIARTHHARLRLEARGGGGLVAEVRFPAPTGPPAAL